MTIKSYIKISDKKICTGTVVGPHTKQILTHSSCCPSQDALLVSHGITGSFVLRISRRYFKGKLQSCILHLEDQMAFTKSLCLPRPGLSSDKTF